MSKSLYRNYIRLLKLWPVDEAKLGRELGGVLRDEIAKSFPKGEASSITNTSDCNRIYESLNRIAKNNHSQKYPRFSDATAMGLSPEDAKKVVSNDFIKLVSEK